MVFAAQGAAVREIRGGTLSFGVAAPLAAKGAALEKDNGADAGPVVDGVLLDVENAPRGEKRDCTGSGDRGQGLSPFCPGTKPLPVPILRVGMKNSV